MVPSLSYTPNYHTQQITEPGAVATALNFQRHTASNAQLQNRER